MNTVQMPDEWNLNKRAKIHFTDYRQGFQNRAFKSQKRIQLEA